MAKRGRPATISVKVDPLDPLRAVDGHIKQCFKSQVRAFSSGGGYVPIPRENLEHEVFVIVTDKKIKKTP